MMTPINRTLAIMTYSIKNLPAKDSWP